LESRKRAAAHGEVAAQVDRWHAKARIGYPLGARGTRTLRPKELLLLWSVDRAERGVLFLRHQRSHADHLWHQPRHAASFLGTYVSRGVLPSDPFVSIDREGVGESMRIEDADRCPLSPHKRHKSGHFLTAASCQYVWPGRAVQDRVPRSTNVRAASMYQASEAEQFAPGHHGYPHASETRYRKAL
jgi:hypothetical protein